MKPIMRKIAFFGLFAAVMLMAVTVLSGRSRAYANNPCSTPDTHSLCVATSAYDAATRTGSYTIQGCGFALSKKAYVQVNGIGSTSPSVKVDSNGCISANLTNVADQSCISAYQSGVKNAIYLRVAGGSGTPGC